MQNSSRIDFGAWDTHVHLFNPDVFPYKPDRIYTPRPAYFEDLTKRSKATNFMIVQASVEPDPKGLIHELRALRNSYPNRDIRGTVLFGVTDENDRTLWSTTKLTELHEVGVRCLRVHGKFGDLSQGTEDFANSVKNTARACIDHCTSAEVGNFDAASAASLGLSARLH